MTNKDYMKCFNSIFVDKFLHLFFNINQFFKESNMKKNHFLHLIFYKFYRVSELFKSEYPKDYSIGLISGYLPFTLLIISRILQKLGFF